ncbi:hypothetical protein PMAYCL1PPCAC_03890, partial [Pristionchus mayeri]
YSAKNGNGTNTFPDGEIALEVMGNNKDTRIVRSMVSDPWAVQLFSKPVQLLQNLNLSDASYAL